MRGGGGGAVRLKDLILINNQLILGGRAQQRCRRGKSHNRAAKRRTGRTGQRVTKGDKVRGRFATNALGSLRAVARTRSGGFKSLKTSL